MLTWLLIGNNCLIGAVEHWCCQAGRQGSALQGQRRSRTPCAAVCTVPILLQCFCPCFFLLECFCCLQLFPLAQVHHDSFGACLSFRANSEKVVGSPQTLGCTPCRDDSFQPSFRPAAPAVGPSVWGLYTWPQSQSVRPKGALGQNCTDWWQSCFSVLGWLLPSRLQDLALFTMLSPSECRFWDSQTRSTEINS